MDLPCNPLSLQGWVLAVWGCVLEPWTAAATIFSHHLSQFDPKIIEQMLFNHPVPCCTSRISNDSIAHFYQIIDDKGNSLPLNTEGYIGISMKPTKPTVLFMGYDENPVKTAEIECGDFYNSGDRATMDEEGYLWFLGRNDDFIKASTYCIRPAEVENALAEQPAVAQSAVVSSPDLIRREVVKALIILVPDFLLHDQDQLIKELQQHVKSGKQRNIFQKLRGNMFLSDEDPKLKENIKTVEQLSENLNDTHQCAHTNMQSEKKKNVKNQDKLQEVFEDPELRVLRSKKCDLEESKKVLEDKCNALSSVKTMKEAELKQLKKKVDTLVEFYEQKRMAAAEKLEKTHYELVAKKNQFSTKEEFFKVATEEIDRYKQQVQEMQEQLQKSELTFRHQIAIHEKNAQDNWVKAQIWEREIVQQSRENAYLKHRLAILEGKMLPERHRRQELIPGRPEMQIPQRRESRPVPEKNSSTIPKKNPEMAKDCFRFEGFLEQ